MKLKQWLCLDDIVYSSQYTLAKMICDFVADNLKEAHKYNEEDKVKFFLLYEAVASIINDDEHAVSNVTLRNKVLTRKTDFLISLVDGMQEWLLAKMSTDYKIETITSAMSSLVGQTNVVYDSNNTIEVLVINALGLSDRINPNQLFTLDEMYNILDKHIQITSDKANRDSIFTANRHIIEKYADKLSIFIPKNFVHCRVNGADSFVEVWTLDTDDSLKKPETI